MNYLTTGFDFNIFWKKILQLRDQVSNRVDDFGAQYIAFGIFGILNYPTFYFIWSYYNKQGYESFWLRFTATILCAFLLAKDFWPKKLKPWLPIYWYFTLSFCIPFFFFFMLFKSNGSATWLMVSNTVIFWLLMMVDWWDYVFLLFGGILLAFLCYFFSTPDFHFNFSNWWGIWAQFIASFLIVGFFTSKKLQYDKYKLKIMVSVSDSIAHELRTPLASIKAGTNIIKDYLPDLIKTYQIANEEKLSIPTIYPDQFNKLKKVLDHVEGETELANSVIDALLINVKQHEIDVKDFQIYQISSCIKEALERYPFSEKERILINWDEKNDFAFLGNKLLTVHILFNLIKNALYYIMAACKGNIEIWTNSEDNFNLLHFRDTGTGIDPSILPYIFDKFFSKTYHGYGVGLAFCKIVMQSYGGNIVCHSTLSEYTEFILKFPKLKK